MDAAGGRRPDGAYEGKRVIGGVEEDMDGQDAWRLSFYLCQAEGEYRGTAHYLI